MSCHLCGLLAGLKQNPILHPHESPYEAGARRGCMGGYAYATLAAHGRIDVDLCVTHREAVRESLELLERVLSGKPHPPTGGAS